ncbi:MAG: tetratricopeptide repeat protein [Caulobacterales bacterium]
MAAAKAQASPQFSASPQDILQSIAALSERGHYKEARTALAELLNGFTTANEDLFQASRFAKALGMSASLIACAHHIAQRTADWRALVSLGMCAMNVEAYADAARLFRRATETGAGNAGVYALLGGALYQSGDTKEARRALTRAIALDPRNALAQHGYGAFCLERGDIDAAIEALRIAASADPGKAYYRVTLGRALIQKELYDEAREILESALGDKAAAALAHLALGQLHRACCEDQAALTAFKNAAGIAPTPDTITPYLFHLLASDAHSDEDVFSEHKRLGGIFDRAYARTKTHSNNSDPGRRLKIGFVSADFHQHSIATFVTPLWRHLDRTRFEIFAIYSNSISDAATAILRKHSDHWLDCFGMPDDTVAAWIEKQQIDILIDLSGHSKLHRLGVFGLRPAPVQASYLGYPGTTGLSSMDYRITCESLDPTGIADAYSTEELVRLPGLMAAFEPQGDVAPNDSPHLYGAPFTFACLNPIWRINPSVMRCWGEILRAKPQAHMLIGNVDRPIVAEHLTKLFAQEQIGVERLDFIPKLPQRDYLKLHHRIDLALDTFPYNGGTTTTYALWMGVPVVTLEGKRTAMRTGAGILREAGLSDFIARTPDEYVARALGWVEKPERLQTLRRELRARIKVTQPGDQKRLADEFGAALQTIWERWRTRA